MCAFLHIDGVIVAVPEMLPTMYCADRDYDFRAYVADIGEPLFVTVKRHWWSLWG